MLASSPLPALRLPPCAGTIFFPLSQLCSHKSDQNALYRLPRRLRVLKREPQNEEKRFS